MRLNRLRLQNFRQHADTEIVFGTGITGVIGPNGSGKTTLLEAIAWAIYGNPAARGDKDSIRNLRAKARSSVRVELDFGVGAHEYKVVRGLHAAELYQDGQLVANSLSEVTAKLERGLGMTHDEFFNTYFTGQKDLAVMAKLTRPERAAFLSRVLRYEQLSIAQEGIREQKNALAAELHGREAGLPERAALEGERAAAGQRLDQARRAAGEAQAARVRAQEAEAREEPRWKAWVQKEKRVHSLDGDRRMAEQAVTVAKQECERLDREMAEALKAREQLDGLRAELEPIERLKREQAALEHLQREETARRADEGQLAELRRTMGVLDRRIAELAPAATALAAVEQEARAFGERLEAAERAAEEQRAAWVREKEYATTRRADLLKQYDEVKEQRDRIEQLGPEGMCPTCRRPLGSEYAEVLGLLDRQMQAIVEDGKYFRQRLEQLAPPPDAVAAAEAAREALVGESRRASERAGELRAQLEERERATAQRRGLETRGRVLDGMIRARPTGYDPQRHDAVRAELTKLEPLALEAAMLAERAKRAEILVKEAELAEQALSVHERRAHELAAAVAGEQFSAEAFATARERHDRTARALREAELAVAETRGELTAAEAGIREVERREAERAARERQIAELKVRLRLHHELDRAFGDLRADLNAAMRPEIAELASGFLADLTDGRYEALDLNEDYVLTILDEGVPKPVISGGEEDVVNLVLRLAISQMIAERAGQPLTLLVLDEIFGSLDEARRQHVVGLLRRLADRFPQVVLITHIEQVREGLDRVIRVDYDAARGTSVVRDDTATLGADDAGVAA
jgi:exonuclease SbcC